jgi:hypothetical protein
LIILSRQCGQAQAMPRPPLGTLETHPSFSTTYGRKRDTK